MTQLLDADALDLTHVREHTWTGLSRAVADQSSPMRTPVLATVDMNGAPQARTVVLRAVDAEGWRVFWYTDIRAPKVAHLRGDARASLAFHDPVERLQWRLSGRTCIRSGDANAAAAWAALSQVSRRNYRTQLPPGTAMPLPGDGIAGDAGEGETGRDRCAVIELVVGTGDWLWLLPRGHRRARITRDAATWLTP
jgi:hypothetical protein